MIKKEQKTAIHKIDKRINWQKSLLCLQISFQKKAQTIELKEHDVWNRSKFKCRKNLVFI